MVVEGNCSDKKVLANSVFQGTVFGPSLWNVFFSDSTSALPSGFTDTTYADDKNMFKKFPAKTEHQTINDEMENCQSQLHKWGVGNCVKFDPTKENSHIIHRRFPSYSEFKVRGVVFDSQLKMHAAVRTLAVQGGWRLNALLRARRFFLVSQMVTLFKSQILSYLESGIVAFFHAPISTMSPDDRILRRFSCGISITEFDALVHYNLAPLV